MDNRDLLHVPNLCVFKTCCDECIKDPQAVCSKCGGANGQRTRVSMDKTHNTGNKAPVEWFLQFVMEKRKVSVEIMIRYKF